MGIPIKERKLQRHRSPRELFVYGRWAKDEEAGRWVIEVDPRQGSKERLDTILHEDRHRMIRLMRDRYGAQISDREEEELAKAGGAQLGAALWRDRWRRIAK